MSTLHIYDRTRDAWGAHIAPDINKVESADYQAVTDSSGNLWSINEALQEMAGGLISPVGDSEILPTDRYFGFDCKFLIPAVDLTHSARLEFDDKVTFSGGAQANYSTQINQSKSGMIQLDPTGTGWADSGFAVTINPNAPNLYQVRGAFDGKVWSVLGLRFNGQEFTPGSAFQNLSAIQTTWGQGMHGQLQTEAQDTPWILRVEYPCFRLLSGDGPIPWSFDL
ncbi:MAG TPA: hypothetical protein VFW94_23410 [Candidatus Acidoferrales bacterium]|nr:hypothetical protein [Candidatus Acidoferrales bacterium]